MYITMSGVCKLVSKMYIYYVDLKCVSKHLICKIESHLMAEQCKLVSDRLLRDQVLSNGTG